MSGTQDAGRDEAQAWVWSERWQQGERQAEADYAAGRFATFDDVESFLADLEMLAAVGELDVSEP